MSNPESILAEGDPIGRYTVVRKLGAGGMGVVYQVRDDDLERDIALKVLPTAVMADEERRLRFMREARSAAAVSHRNIAMVHEVGEDQGRVFIAMELVRGETLADCLARGPLPLDQTVSIALEIARGAGKAHETGVIHRDLKPANVMLDEDGGVKILDFGLAKRFDVDQADECSEHDETVRAITAEGRVLGTPGYMAPEQAEGRPLGPPADVFAIGTILYEMLAGEMAFGGRSTAVRIAATLKDDPPPLTERAPDAPDVLVQLVQRTLAKDPADRPADAGEVACQLEALNVTLPSGNRVTIRPPGATGSSRAESVHLDETVLATSSGRRPWWALVLLLPLLAAGAWWWARSSLPHREPESAVPPPALGPDTETACPIWTVAGQKGPPGRLGAAAATQACADWTLLLGGPRLKRGPAQLLALPLLPLDDFPAHPFAAPDARERSLAAARKSAVQLDGHLVLVDGDFEVTVVLERVGQDSAPTAKAKHRILSLAIRQAVRSLAKHVGLPSQQPLPEGVAELTSCSDVDCYLDAAALSDAIVNDFDRAKSCQALARRDLILAGVRARDCGHLERLTDGLPNWPEGFPGALGKLPDAGRAFWSSLLRLHVMKPETAKVEADQVRRLREGVRDRLIEAPLALAEAVLLFRAGEVRSARPLLDRAYQLEPNHCTARIAAFELAFDDSVRTQLARAATAWCPTVAETWLYQFSVERGDDGDIELMRTAYYLRGGSMTMGIGFAEALLAEGRAQEARIIASRYLAGDPRERLAGAYLQARVDMASGQLGAGLDQLVKLIEQLERLGDPELQRADLAAVMAALHFGELVGRAQPVAELLIHRFLLAEPPPVESPGPFLFAYAISHASAATAKRAIPRLEALMEQGKLWKLDDVAPYLEGVRRYQAGNAKGAVEAWRPLVAKPVFRQFLRPEVFDAAGESALASTLDSQGIEDAGANVGLLFAREAHRAAARGDHDLARRLAKTFIEAWATADVKVPAVDDLRALAKE